MVLYQYLIIWLISEIWQEIATGNCFMVCCTSQADWIRCLQCVAERSERLVTKGRGEGEFAK